LRDEESSRNLYVIFSMDCERIANEALEGGGPRSWEIGREAISRFSEILSNEGFRAVFLFSLKLLKGMQTSSLSLRILSSASISILEILETIASRSISDLTPPMNSATYLA